jgi:CubicO group peptidase (beta-lactamase class C family)
VAHPFIIRQSQVLSSVEVTGSNVRLLKTPLIALLAIVSLQHETSAQQQNLPFALFERSLDQLRQEAGIPGLSAAIVQDGRIIWENAFGMADIEQSIPARADTPYPIVDITQTLAAVLALESVDRARFELDDRIIRWTAQIPEQNATVRQVLMHTSTGAYRYDPARYSALTPVIEYNAGRIDFRKVIADQILDKAAMFDSVPGVDILTSSDRSAFDSNDLERYSAVLTRMAVAYKVNTQRRATRSEYASRPINAGAGLVSTVRDLAKFDGALDMNLFSFSDDLRKLMWAPAGAVNGMRIPTGLGWFVQTRNNERLVWHFGLATDAYSSLVLKIPERHLTLILLANSDGLSSPFALGQGDVTTSLFAQAFLRVFVP